MGAGLHTQRIAAGGTGEEGYHGLEPVPLRAGDDTVRAVARKFTENLTDVRAGAQHGLWHITGEFGGRTGQTLWRLGSALFRKSSPVGGALGLIGARIACDELVTGGAITAYYKGDSRMYLTEVAQGVIFQTLMTVTMTHFGFRGFLPQMILSGVVMVVGEQILKCLGSDRETTPLTTSGLLMMMSGMGAMMIRGRPLRNLNLHGAFDRLERSMFTPRGNLYGLCYAANSAAAFGAAGPSPPRQPFPLAKDLPLDVVLTTSGNEREGPRIVEVTRFDLDVGKLGLTELEWREVLVQDGPSRRRLIETLERTRDDAEAPLPVRQIADMDLRRILEADDVPERRFHAEVTTGMIGDQEFLIAVTVTGDRIRFRQLVPFSRLEPERGWRVVTADDIEDDWSRAVALAVEDARRAGPAKPVKPRVAFEAKKGEDIFIYRWKDDPDPVLWDERRVEVPFRVEGWNQGIGLATVLVDHADGRRYFLAASCGRSRHGGREFKRRTLPNDGPVPRLPRGWMPVVLTRRQGWSGTLATKP